MNTRNRLLTTLCAFAFILVLCPMAFAAQKDSVPAEGGSSVVEVGALQANAGEEAGQAVDTSLLQVFISNARQLLETVATSETGNDVANGSMFASEAAKRLFSIAVAAAESRLEDGGLTQEQVNGATQALALARMVFEDAIDTADVDTAALAEAIKKAQTDAAEVLQSVDGSDIEAGREWVTKEAKDALDKAIAAAQEAIDNGDAQNAVDLATQALKEAQAAFDRAKQEGTDTAEEPTSSQPSSQPASSQPSSAKDEPSSSEPSSSSAPSSSQPAGNHAIWERLAGKNALGTMRSIAQEGWETADTVVVATLSGYWDALSASALAGKYDAPILLTSSAVLSPDAIGEIQRLKAKHAIIVGGRSAVSPLAEVVLSGMSVSCERIAGANAQATAVDVASRLAKDADTCIVATSAGFWDALSASPYAYAKKYPIYLTNTLGELKAETLAAIKAGGFSRAIIAGGTGAVAGKAEGDLKAAGIKDVQRKAGANAIATSGQIASFAIQEGMSANHMGVATSTDFYDALTGGPLCGKQGGVLVLASPNNTSNASLSAARAADIKRAYVFGGAGALPTSVFDAFEASTK